MMYDPGYEIPNEETNTCPIQGHRNRRPTNVVCLCLVLFSLVGNIVLITIATYKLLTESTQNGFNSGFSDGIFSRVISGLVDRDSICATCNELGPGIESRDTLYDVFRLGNNKTLCCLRTPNTLVDKLHKMVQAELYYQEKGLMPANYHPLSDLSRAHVGAHLYIKFTQGEPGLKMSYSPEYCNSCTCQDGNITVPDSGTYFVYSYLQISTFPFQESKSSFLHVIDSRNLILNNNPVVLLQNRFSAGSQKYSFLSAILKLRTKDSLRVFVSEIDWITKRNYMNYFGIFKMK